MKKFLLGFLAVVMLYGVNVYASEEEGIIDVEVKDRNLSEIVSIVSDINVNENVRSVTYDIKNDKAIIYVALEDTSKYDETKTDIFAIDGVQSLDETNNEIATGETVSENNCKCDTLSDKDLENIVRANYILYATLAILLILIVVILVLIIKERTTKKKNKK